MSASHGNTPAAWIAVAVGLLGILIGCVGMMLDPINWTVFWVGLGVTAVGGLLFIVLAKLGFNVESH